MLICFFPSLSLALSLSLSLCLHFTSSRSFSRPLNNFNYSVTSLCAFAPIAALAHSLHFCSISFSLRLNLSGSNFIHHIVFYSSLALCYIRSFIVNTTKSVKSIDDSRSPIFAIPLPRLILSNSMAQHSSHTVRGAAHTCMHSICTHGRCIRTMGRSLTK